MQLLPRHHHCLIEHLITFITFFSKAIQACDNRWRETLKKAKSSIMRLTTVGPALGSFQHSPRTPDGRLALGRQAAREDA